MSFIQNKKKLNFFVCFVITCCCILLFTVGFFWGRQKRLNECKKTVFENEMKTLEKEKTDKGAEKAKLQEEEMATAVKMWPQEELDEMLIMIQKEYAFDQWYYSGETKFDKPRYGIPNTGDKDEFSLKAEDLEEVNFYQDKEGVTYFIPITMINKVVEMDNREVSIHEFNDEGAVEYSLFWCKCFKTDWKRLIYPEPDNKYVYFSWVQDMGEKIEELYLIGTARVPFPENIPEEAFISELYENEYTNAVTEIIHSWLYEREMYGEYQIYVGYYGVVCDTNSLLNSGYNIVITVAIIPKGEKIEMGMWWIFRAKDILDENGRVVVETDGGAGHSSPIPYNYYNEAYAPRIEQIVTMNRLMIPLRITENDEVQLLGWFTDEDDLNTIHYYLK